MRDATLNTEARAAYLRLKAPFLQGARCRLEVLDPERKKVVEADGVLLRAVELDEEADRIRVEGDGLSHVIESPGEIRVLEDESLRPVAMEITDGRGIRHVFHLTPPRALV